MAQQFSPQHFHQPLQLFWEDHKRSPKSQLTDWLDEFKMYVKITYQMSVDLLFTQADYGRANEGKLQEKTTAISSLLLVRDIAWLHSGEETKRKLKQRYPSQNQPVHQKTYQQFLICLNETQKVVENKELKRSHLRQMQQGKLQRYDDFRRKTQAQAIKCQFQANTECEMMKGFFAQGMRAVTGCEQKQIKVADDAIGQSWSIKRGREK